MNRETNYCGVAPEATVLASSETITVIRLEIVHQESAGAGSGAAIQRTMPLFSANLSLMFTELPFLDRFAAAADTGFTAVEMLFPYEHSPDLIGERLSRSSLTLALFNLPPGDWAAGERGLAALPDRFDELKSGVERALAYAEAAGAKRLHLMAGLADSRDPAARDRYIRAVTWCAERLERSGLDLLIEPINSRDMPGYFLSDVDMAAELISNLHIINLKLQFDIYHCQILHGDVTHRLRRRLPMIGHVQIASVPDRAEPGIGKLNDAYLFSELDRLGYQGFVGCEYRPKTTTAEGLGWFTPFRVAKGDIVSSDANRLSFIENGPGHETGHPGNSAAAHKSSR